MWLVTYSYISVSLPAKLEPLRPFIKIKYVIAVIAILPHRAPKYLYVFE